MSFTNIARIMVYLTITVGTLRLLSALAVLSSGDPIAAARRLLGSTTAGAAIDQALLVIFIAICVGVLTDISQSLRAIVNSQK
jgi:hypothetical protein